MKKKTQRDPRGRKTNPRGKILANGLYESQWERVQEDADERGLLGGAVLLREIVDFYYSAKSQEDGQLAQEDKFNKLKKEK